MSLVIEVPDDIASSAEEMARRSGTPAKDLLLSALRAHFPPIPPALRDELDALKRASDEDMLAVDQLLAAG